MNTALKLTLLFALLFSVVGVQSVGFVKGNFYPFYGPSAGADPPKISILSPKNNTAYSSGDLNITVHITRSEISFTYTFESWNIRLFLDGVLLDSVSDYIPRSKVEVNKVVHDPFTGKHKLEVRASYGIKSMNRLVSLESSSTIYFTVSNILSSSSPSSSQSSTLTPEPSQELNPIEVDVQNTSQYVVAGGMFAFTVLVVFIGLGLLVYLIKRK